MNDESGSLFIFYFAESPSQSFRDVSGAFVWIMFCFAEAVVDWLCFSLAVMLESPLWSPLSLPQVQCCLFPPFFTLCLLHLSLLLQSLWCPLQPWSRRLKHINLFSEMHRCKYAQQKKKPLTSLCVSLVLSHFLFLSLHCTTRTYLNAYESD